MDKIIKELMDSYEKENFYVPSKEEISKLKELSSNKLPEEFLNGLSICAPSKVIERDSGFVLYPIERILEENQAAVPGINIFTHGFFTFAGTLDGDALCIDLKSKNKVVYLCSHSLLSDEKEISFYKDTIGMVTLPLNYENIKKCSIKLAISFEQFIEKIKNYELEPVNIIETVIKKYKPSKADDTEKTRQSTKKKDQSPVVSIKDHIFLDCLVKACKKNRTGIITQKDMEKLKELELPGNIQSIDGIEYAVNLTSLRIGFCCEDKKDHMEDWRPLIKLLKLKELGIFCYEIKDYTWLERCKSLESIWLNDDDVTDLSFARQLENLKDFTAMSNHIADITPFSELKNLETLTLYDNQIKDVEPLMSLTSLRILDLRCNGIKTIKGISNLKNLESLSLDENEVEDISELAGIIGLKRVGLSDNRIIDCTSLVGLERLETLDLRGNPLKKWTGIIEKKIKWFWMD
ncbi:leucine-rich repeat domain-containing protein [Clostridiaceae bacterium UIB06]|nr:leucine-rich repeat domain-containing protein [Clostridiaceae bacterium UIB06]